MFLPTTTYRAEAFVEAAWRLGIALTVVSEEDSAFAAREPERVLTVDFRSLEEVRGLARAFAHHTRVDATFGVDDGTAIAAAAAAEALGLPHNPLSAVQAAGDKYRQRERLSAAGVPVPRYTLRDLSDLCAGSTAVPFPVVLKPRHLAASRGVIRANDESELRAAATRIEAILQAADLTPVEGGRSSVLIEEYVPGREVALDALLRDGELHVLALWDKPDPLEGPYFAETLYVTPSRAPPSVQEALVRCAADAARALGLERGPVHAELRVNQHGPWLIELAARPIGGKCGQALRFGTHGSTSLEEVLLAHALDPARAVPPREPSAAGVLMLPVPARGTLREVRGVDAARRTCGVSDVVVAAHAGQALVPLPDEARFVGFVFARGAEPQFVEEALRQAWRRLEIVLA